MKYDVGIREVFVRSCRAVKLTAMFQRDRRAHVFGNDGVGPSPQRCFT